MAVLQQFIHASVLFFVDLTESGELGPYTHLLPKINGQILIHKCFAIPNGKVSHSKAQMMEILDTIDSAINSGHTVYVHC